MSPVSPQWLDEEFILKLLQDGDNDRNIVVKNFDVTAAVPPGTNFSSNLWRVSVEYYEKGCKHISLILKEQIMESPIKIVFDQCGPSEAKFYNRFLPLASRILPEDHFAPKTFLSLDPMTIVMTDLNSEGYSVGDRRTLLDFEHCRLYAMASAALHASSVAIYKEQPELIESLGSEKMFSNDEKSIVIKKQNMFARLECMAECVAVMDGYKEYAELIHNSTSYIWDKIVKLHERNPTLNALHQGDPWITNMMFKYDDHGKPVDVKLLDFQLMRYASPVNELVFFIWTSASHEVREDRLEELYHVYYDTLNRKLEECNCPERLSYERLTERLEEMRPFFLGVAASFYPVFNSEKPVDVKTLRRDGCNEIRESCKAVYNELYCKTHLPRLVKQLELCGVFEYLKCK